jgi:ketosteroid isomerase-like protein
MRLSLQKTVWLCVSFVVIAIVIASVQRVRASVQSEVQGDLIASEQKLHRAITGGDKKAFLALASDDAVWVSGAGFVPAPMFGDALDQVKLTNSDIENPQVVPVNADTAIVVSVWTGSGTVLGRPFTQKLTSTVWTKRESKWVAVYHHESDAATRQ